MEKQTTLAGWAGLLISGLAMVLAGCAGFDGIPREAGLYAIEDGDPVRLDGDPEWERETWEQRANLPPQVSFLVRTDDLATAPDTLQQHIQVHKVGWVRSEITQAGNIQPITGSQWANARIEELQVPVRLSRHRDHDNVDVALIFGGGMTDLGRVEDKILRGALVEGGSPGICCCSLRGSLSGQHAKLPSVRGTGTGHRQPGTGCPPGAA